MTHRFFVAFFFFIFIIQATHAQQLIVRGRFLADSVKIGGVTGYALSAQYPSELNILFPDSTTNTFPFEYDHRSYFATRTKNGISTDSVVYYFSTFEPDSIQLLSLPVYVVHQMDCTAVYTTPDSLRLRAMIGAIPDSVALHDLPLVETVTYETIPTSFNAVVIALVLGMLMLLVSAGYAIFGKKIMRHYRLNRLRKNHQKFLQGYSLNLSRLRDDASSIMAESTVGMWKKYLENLELTPYTKLTTKETIQLLKDESIKTSLQTIDRSIYGNQAVKVSAFEGLREFADTKFRKKLQEVMNE
jgi:hypothetical protein